MKLESSVVSYEDRGHWGNSRFRGNTSGHIVVDLLDTFVPETVLDPMEGSGTTREVCEEYPAVEYFGYDLARGHNLLDPATQEEMRTDLPSGVDLIFWHPPYWNMIRYHEDNPNDFAFGSYPMFLNRMEHGMVFLAKLLNGRKTSRLAILMGDLRSAGVYYWIPRDICNPSALSRAGLAVDSVVIKKQNNVKSDRNQYGGRLIRIQHETLLIFKPRRA